MLPMGWVSTGGQKEEEEEMKLSGEVSEAESTVNSKSLWQEEDLDILEMCPVKTGEKREDGGCVGYRQVCRLL